MNGSTAKRADAAKTASAILQRKIESGTFDVFLCHNHRDKPKIKAIGEELKAQGVLPWLDEWQLRPGLPWQRALEEQIESVQSAAVFVGAEGIGPWQHQELDAFLREFVDRGRPVIPVVLSEAPDIPDLPIFLKGMTWVDFRTSDPDPMEQLLWGITGEHDGASAGSLLPKRPVSSRTEPAGAAPANPAAFPSPPAFANLAQLLIGSWQVQITNPFGMVGQMVLQIMPNGIFRGQLPTPMGMTMVEGQWQLTPLDQLSLQGRQFIGFQVMPYMTVIQLKQTAPFQLVGMTTAGEQTIWQKMA
jgi:TIR domain